MSKVRTRTRTIKITLDLALSCSVRRMNPVKARRMSTMITTAMTFAQTRLIRARPPRPQPTRLTEVGPERLACRRLIFPIEDGERRLVMIPPCHHRGSISISIPNHVQLVVTRAAAVPTPPAEAVSGRLSVV